MAAVTTDFFLVIVTFNREDYLRNLLTSVAALDPAPAAVVVVNNASTDGTAGVIERARTEMAIRIIDHSLPTNVGGSGGFSAGLERALAEGANYVWMMDDDVEALPSAVGALRPWLDHYGAVVGRRYDSTGGPFFWQHKFSTFLGFPLPVSRDVFAHSEVFHTDVGCFEGMAVTAAAVRKVGLPDPRFFLTWDDTTYGWLMSLNQPVAYVNEFVLRKARPQRQIDLGVRHLNDSNDLSRFYVMRNRALVAKYLQSKGKYQPIGFALGTALTAVKELLRLFAVERTIRGVGALWRGWKDARKLFQDMDWEPMPPLAKLPSGSESTGLSDTSDSSGISDSSGHPGKP